MPLISGTPRWQKIATFVLLVLIAVAVGFIYLRVGNTNAAVRATKNSVARADCARQVNAEQAKARDDATLADRATNRYYFKAVLEATATRASVTQKQIDEFTALISKADNADRVVDELPELASEVERRCPG